MRKTCTEEQRSCQHPRIRNQDPRLCWKLHVSTSLLSHGRCVGWKCTDGNCDINDDSAPRVVKPYWGNIMNNVKVMHSSSTQDSAISNDFNCTCAFSALTCLNCLLYFDRAHKQHYICVVHHIFPTLLSLRSKVGGQMQFGPGGGYSVLQRDRVERKHCQKCSH